MEKGILLRPPNLTDHSPKRPIINQSSHRTNGRDTHHRTKRKLKCSKIRPTAENNTTKSSSRAEPDLRDKTITDIIFIGNFLKA